MKKKIFIGLGAVLVIFVGYLGYNFLFPKSPPTSTSFSANGLDISVTYSQPSKRGRVIFGEEKDGALQPYGKYWRLGANAATEITFSKNITFGGQPVKAGAYRMYAIPGAETFKVILNSELGVTLSAASGADQSLDVVSVDAPVTMQSAETEKFVINFGSDSTGVKMDFVWDKTLFTVPITIQ
jgi:hypothetical protein